MDWTKPLSASPPPALNIQHRSALGVGPFLLNERLPRNPAPRSRLFSSPLSQYHSQPGSLSPLPFLLAGPALNWLGESEPYLLFAFPGNRLSKAHITSLPSQAELPQPKPGIRSLPCSHGCPLTGAVPAQSSQAACSAPGTGLGPVPQSLRCAHSCGHTSTSQMRRRRCGEARPLAWGAVSMDSCPHGAAQLFSSLSNSVRSKLLSSFY